MSAISGEKDATLVFTKATSPGFLEGSVLGMHRAPAVVPRSPENSVRAVGGNLRLYLPDLPT